MRLQVSLLTHAMSDRKEMGRATSAVLASLVTEKLVFESNYMAFAIDASIEIKSLLWFESRDSRSKTRTHAAAAYAFGSKHACCSKLELATSCSRRLFQSP